MKKVERISEELLKVMQRDAEKMEALQIISCTEAGKILNMTKQQVRHLVDEKKLTNYGIGGYRYMVSKVEVDKHKLAQNS